MEESLTGNSNTSQKNHVHVDRNIIIDSLANYHKVGKKEFANLIFSHAHCQGLDDGELHLFAWLYAHGHHASALISTADKAAIVSASRLGWLAGRNRMATALGALHWSSGKSSRIMNLCCGSAMTASWIKAYI